MTDFRLLLATDRPAVHTFFSSLALPDGSAITITPLPVTPAALETVRARLKTYTAAVVDLDMDPVAAIEVYHGLRAQHPTLPLMSILCRPHPVSAWHLQALVAAGAYSVIDLHATSREAARALEALARGEVVLHARLGPDFGALMAQMIGMVPGGAGPPSAAALNESEATLLRLVAQGLSDREIGQQRHLSRYTVNHQIERLRGRIGVRNRVELAAWAGRNGFYQMAPHVSRESHEP